MTFLIFSIYLLLLFLPQVELFELQSPLAQSLEPVADVHGRHTVEGLLPLVEFIFRFLLLGLDSVVHLVLNLVLDVALQLKFLVDVGILEFTVFKVFIEGLELLVLFQMLQFLMPVERVFISVFMIVWVYIGLLS